MYSTQNDIALSENDLISLTDDDGSGSVDSTVLNAAILRADRVIDAYLRSRYITPFNPAPPEIVEISATLAKYYLQARRMDTPPEGTRQEQKDAMALLKDLQTGRASLNETGQSADLDRSPGRIVTNRMDKEKMFPASVLNKY